jgi:hypothetical protein
VNQIVGCFNGHDAHAVEVRDTSWRADNEGETINVDAFEPMALSDAIEKE